MNTNNIRRPSPEVIKEAAQRLAEGGLVVLPTETVYGLGGSTMDEVALQAIFELKGRPKDNPLIAHVAEPMQAKSLVTNWDERCDLLADRFWPGPLTMVLMKDDSVPTRATGGRTSIAVRCPRHPVALAVLEQFGGPVSAPSANRSGSVSPTTALHVVQDYVDHDAAEDLFIIDGGSCDVGIESTVLDLTTQPPRVLRPGSITVDELAKLIGPVSSTPLHAQDVSPGTQPRHYAPRIPMELVDREQLAGRLLDSSARIAVLTCGPCEVEGANMLLKLPDDPIQYAELLYATIRHADEAEVDQLLVVRPGGDDPAWRAVLDRLERATSSQHGS